MTIKNILTYMFLSAIFFGCSKKCDDTVTQIGEYYAKLRNISSPSISPKVHFFIPMGGCQDCVLKSIRFSKQHIGDTTILFALISQTGKKTISINYEIDEIIDKNFIIDGEGEAYSKRLIGENITVYYENNGCLTRKDVASHEFDEALEMVQKIIE